VFYGEEFSEEECERLILKIRKQDLDSFKVAARACLEELKAVYGGEVTDTEKKRGLMLKFDTAATVMTVRFMHKSSGGFQYKTHNNEFRIHSGKHPLGKDGKQAPHADSHFELEGCPEKEIHDIINKHIKWRRHKGKHLKKK
jgi:hypothetical protein